MINLIELTIVWVIARHIIMRNKKTFVNVYGGTEKSYDIFDTIAAYCTFLVYVFIFELVCYGLYPIVNYNDYTAMFGGIFVVVVMFNIYKNTTTTTQTKNSVIIRETTYKILSKYIPDKGNSIVRTSYDETF